MELTKIHREALILELKESIQALKKSKDLLQYHLDRANLNDSYYVPSQEIDIFLLEQKIKTIEAALIANEIDY